MMHTIRLKRRVCLLLRAASALIEIEKDKTYHNSLIGSDVALFDSGFLHLYLEFLKNIKLKNFQDTNF